MNNRIKVYRALNDITQEELAREIGVTRQTILALENRQYDPSLLLAAKIAHYFGKRIDEIFLIDNEWEPANRGDKS
jgi:putative transcriptional regulator